MKTRCYNKNELNYKNYGGRGITICPRWLDAFENFYADMGPKPSPEHSIERINNDEPYSPENCKWATPTEQAQNKRNTILITANGFTRPVKEWEKITGIPSSTLKARLKYGLSHQDCVTRPVRRAA